MLKRSTLVKYFKDYVYAALDDTTRQENKPFPLPYEFRPYQQSKTVGWTHYGLMIPDLPEPHQFFSIMSIIGTSGTLAFDTDHMLKDSPRRNATAVIGTASTSPKLFESYSIPSDCQFTEDGSRISFGQTLHIQGTYPHFHVKAKIADFEIDLQLHCTDKVSWFVKTPVYDHFSLLTQYQGTVKNSQGTQAIQGLCTFEYAKCISPYLLRDRPLSPKFKVPLDFFTYQIINLDDQTQLLLNDTRIDNVPIVSKAFLRGVDSYNQSYAAKFEVLSHQPQPCIAPDGIQMMVPQKFKWQIFDKNDKVIYEIIGTVDTQLTYGLGSGYVGGYSYEGNHKNQPIQGRGYIEYIDRRTQK